MKKMRKDKYLKVSINDEGNIIIRHKFENLERDDLQEFFSFIIYGDENTRLISSRLVLRTV